MNLPTAIVLGVIISVFLSIVFCAYKNKKKGKTSCSCGGNCKACGGHCHETKE